MLEYPWSEKNNIFTWLSSLYSPFNVKYDELAQVFIANTLKPVKYCICVSPLI